MSSNNADIPTSLKTWLKEHRLAVRYGAVLIIVPLLIRSLVLPHAAPRMFPDTLEYVRLSEALQHFDLSPFYRRTPGYPLFLSVISFFLGKGNPKSVVAVQMLISVFVPLLIFLTFLHITPRKWSAFIAALLVSLDLFLVGNDTVILTESLATVQIALGTWLFIEGFRRRSVLYAVIASAVIVFLALTRPLFAALFIIFSIVGVGWVLLRKKDIRPAHVLRYCVVFFVIVFVFIIGWMLRNALAYNVFGISASMGCNITNLTGSFIDDVPTHTPEEAAVVDLYVEQRAKDGTHIMAIWKILPELEERYGLSEPEVAAITMRLSRRAIVKNPGAYFSNVLKSWGAFWGGRYTFYFSPGAMKYLYKHPVFGNILSLYERVFFGAPGLAIYLPALFILAGIALIIIRKGDPFAVLALAIIMLTVLYTAIVSSLVEMGENPRYRTPVEPFIIGIIALGIIETGHLIAIRITTKNHTGEE